MEGWQVTDMIKTSDVLTWLKTKFPSGVTWGVGAIDKTKESVIGIYTRQHGLLQPKAVGYPSQYAIKSITLLVHWSKTFTPCEEKALEVYEMLNACHTQEQIGGRSCWIEARLLPVVIGKDANGIFEAVVDFDIYVRKD